MKLFCRIRRGAPGAVLIAIALAAAVQIAAAAGPATPAPTAPAPAAEPAADPLGRSSPRGTIVEFMRAAERDDSVAAARYLQLTPGQRRDPEALVDNLKELVVRHFDQAIGSISDAPDGALDDGLPLDREQVGPLVIGETRAVITLVRVKDPQAGRIWLVSAETLAQVPMLRRSVAPTWVERVMPASLLGRDAFGISWAQWVALLGSLIVPALLLVAISGLAARLAAVLLRHPAHRELLEHWHSELRWPASAVLALGIHLTALLALGLPLTFRLAWARVGLAFLVLCLAWLLRRVLTLAFERARSIAWGKDRANTQSLLLLGERVVKAVLILGALLAILAVAGVDMGTALAGVGIGGVALALGAQKTVENFLGGVFLLSDKALAVGDLCSISNRVGRVEDITLRSVRLRMMDQSLLSIPAGVLAQAGIENFATREKLLLQTMLRLRHGTNVDQLQRILEGIRALLAQEARLEPDSARIRLVDIGQQAIELELFAYVLTVDFTEFLDTRETLLLKIAALVEAAGSGFAQPTTSISIETAARPVSPPSPAVLVREPGTPKEVQPGIPVRR